VIVAGLQGQLAVSHDNAGELLAALGVQPHPRCSPCQARLEPGEAGSCAACAAMMDPHEESLE
jgi:hypothetical protein